MDNTLSKFSSWKKLSFKPLILFIVFLAFLALAYIDFMFTYNAFSYTIPDFGSKATFAITFFVILLFNFGTSFAYFCKESFRRIITVIFLVLFIVSALLNFTSNVVGFSAEKMLVNSCNSIISENADQLRTLCSDSMNDFNTLELTVEQLLIREEKDRGGRGPFYHRVASFRDDFLLNPEREIKPDCGFLEHLPHLTNETPIREKKFSCFSFAESPGEASGAAAPEDDRIFNRLNNLNTALSVSISNSYYSLNRLCDIMIKEYEQGGRMDVINSTNLPAICSDIRDRVQTKPALVTDTKNTHQLFTGAPLAFLLASIWGIFLGLCLISVEKFCSFYFVQNTLIKNRWKTETERILIDIKDDDNFTSDKVKALVTLLTETKMRVSDYKKDEKLSNIMNRLILNGIVRSSFFVPFFLANRLTFSSFYERWFKDDLKKSLKETLKAKRKKERNTEYDLDNLPDLLEYQQGFIKWLETKEKPNPAEVTLNFQGFVDTINRCEEGFQDDSLVINLSTDTAVFYQIADSVHPLITSYEKNQFENQYRMDKYLIRSCDRQQHQLTVSQNFPAFVKSAELFDLLFKTTQPLPDSIVIMAKKVRTEADRRELSMATIKGFMSLIKDMGAAEKETYALDIAKFHLEAAKSFSHTGDFESVRNHINDLKTIFNAGKTSRLRKERAPYLLEASVIEANALADILKVDDALEHVGKAIHLYPEQDNFYWKAMSAKANIQIHAGEYMKAIKDLEKTVDNISQDEILQPEIHYITALARAGKLDQAVERYHHVEQKAELKKQYKFKRTEKSIEFLRLAGSEIMLMAQPSKRAYFYEKLDNLPPVFHKNDPVSAKYHNQIFTHNLFLLELLSMTNQMKKPISKNSALLSHLKSEPGVMDSFYVQIADDISSMVEQKNISILTLIKLGMVASYLYLLEAKNVRGRETVTQTIHKRFKKHFPGFTMHPEFEHLHNTCSEHYSRLRKNPVLNTRQLNKLHKASLYLLPRL